MRYTNEQVKQMISNKEYEKLFNFIGKTIDETLNKFQNIYDKADIKQEILVSMMESKFDKYRDVENTPFLSWVFMVARNYILDVLRHRNSKKNIKYVSGGLEPSYCDMYASDRQVNLYDYEVEDFVYRMDKRKRLIFDAKVEGLTNVEVAERTGYKKGRIGIVLREMKKDLNI